MHRVDNGSRNLLPLDLQRRIAARAKHCRKHIIFEHGGVHYVAFTSGRIIDVTRHGGAVPENICRLEREHEIRDHDA